MPSDDVLRLNPTWHGKGQVKPKYGNKRETRDGYSFDSGAEARYYAALKLEEQAGAITDLRVHPVYDLVVEGWRVGRYEGDFDYQRGGVLEVVDVKGVRTREYRMKKALMQALFGIEIVEIAPKDIP